MSSPAAWSHLVDPRLWSNPPKLPSTPPRNPPRSLAPQLPHSSHPGSKGRELCAIIAPRAARSQRPAPCLMPQDKKATFCIIFGCMALAGPPPLPYPWSIKTHNRSVPHGSCASEWRAGRRCEGALCRHACREVSSPNCLHLFICRVVQPASNLSSADSFARKAWAMGCMGSYGVCGRHAEARRPPRLKGG